MFLFELFGWIEVALTVFGMAICIAYSRLSDRMAWLVLAFGILACSGAAARLASLAVTSGLISQDITVVFFFTGLANVMAWGFLVFALLGVFKDIRERFHFVREAYESQREKAPPTSVTTSESIFEPTDPTR